MTEIKITISGFGSTFGNITRLISETLESRGAKIQFQIDHESALIENGNIYLDNFQIENRIVVIETKSLPWGG